MITDISGDKKPVHENMNEGEEKKQKESAWLTLLQGQRITREG